MRVKKTALLFFMAIFFVCPFSLRAQVPPSFETPPAVTEGEARKFLEEYIVQYMRKDIQAFMDFFSKDAIENRMIAYNDIRAIYRGTFENSESLQYDLEIDSIQIKNEGARVTGRYQVTQTLKGGHLRKRFKGNIQWDLVREDGFLKIKEILYGRDYRADQPSHPYP